MHEAAVSSGERLLRLPEVEARTGLKKSAIYAGMKATPPTFPPCIKLGQRAAAWPLSSIDAWIADRIATAPRKR
jgi:prophage regulatory protein